MFVAVDSEDIRVWKFEKISGLYAREASLKGHKGYVKTLLLV